MGNWPTSFPYPEDATPEKIEEARARPASQYWVTNMEREANAKFRLKTDIPITEKGYDLLYVVNPEGNNETAAPNTTRRFKTIVAATQAAAVQQAAGLRTLVHVQKGFYNEHQINRQKVDMYFDEWAFVCPSSTTGSTSVFTDTHIGAATTLNVFGKGSFYHQNNNPGNDREAINFRYASTVNIEAKEVDSIQIWTDAVMGFTMRNASVLYYPVSARNKTLRFYDCIFQTGYSDGGYRGANTTIETYNCEYILPSVIPNIYEVKDEAGNVVTTVNRTVSSDYPASGQDISGMTMQQVIDFVPPHAGATHYTAAIDFIENKFNNWGDDYNNHKLRIHSPIIRVRRSKCIGIRALSHYDNPDSEVVIKNAIVYDETTDRQSVALVTGENTTVTTKLGFGIDGLSSNATILAATPTGYNTLNTTFKPLASTREGASGLTQSELDARYIKSSSTRGIEALTQAQYDALPQAQKDDTTIIYAIKQ